MRLIDANLQPTCNQLATDLISRKAAIEALNDSAELLRRALDDTNVVGTERAKFEFGLGLIESCICDMEELLSTDAVPVKRGEWIQTDKAPYVYECSECGYGFTDVKLSYCYDCGSKMDLKGEENE